MSKGNAIRNGLEFERGTFLPILKWAGGKSILNKTIEKNYINLSFNRYIETFFGGGAVFFNIINKFNIEKKDLYINDANKDLIQLYKHIKSKSSSLIKEYEKLLQNYNLQWFYSMILFSIKFNFKELLLWFVY